MVLFSAVIELKAQPAPSKEYQLKAAYLLRFAQFVEWPTNAFPESKSPIVIGVLGEDPFGSYLDEIVRGETVNNRPLVVQRYRQTEEIKTCHMLFVSRSETARLRSIMDGLRGRTILTVSDAEAFAQEGGIIRFMTEKNKIRFRINLEAAKAAGLVISSKLLRSAEIVIRTIPELCESWG